MASQWLRRESAVIVFLLSLLTTAASAQSVEAAPRTITNSTNSPLASAKGVPEPVSLNSSPAAQVLLKEFYARSKRTTNQVAIGQQLITYEYGKKSDPSAWYG